jgi:hypothetical protein
VNKKKILKLTCLIACTIIIVGLLVTTPVFADVGNNNRYSSNSSSDSDSDTFFLVYILFDLLGPIPTLFILIIGGIIYYVMKKRGKLTKMENIETNNRVSTIVDNSEIIANQIREIDPKFSADAFIGWSREVFMKIQTAWSTRNWEEIRPFESNELFNQHNMQLNEYINNKKINKVEKINIKKVALQSFKIDGDKEVLTVYLDAILRDYVVDETTNKVLESDPNKDWYMTYIMTFNRRHGVKTEPGLSNKSTSNCPNCAAPTDITSSGKCEYCKTIITTGDHDWILSDIRSREQ